MNIKNIKIGTQFKFGLILPMFFVGVLGIVAYLQSNKLFQKTETLYFHPLIVGRTVGLLNSDIYALHRDLKDLSYTSNNTEIKVELDWIKWWLEDAANHIDTISKQYLGPRKDVDSLRQYFDTLKEVCDETIVILKEGKKEEVYSRTKTFGIVGYKVEKLMEKLKVINDFAVNKGNQLHDQSVKLNETLNKQLLFLVIAILLFSLIVNLILLKNISKPIAEMTDVTKRFHEGDMDARCSYISKNEFGVLSGSFNEMVERIKTQSEEKEKRTEELGYVKGRAAENEAINEELRLTNHQLKLAKDKAEESDRLKSAFLANMSHEIRTPMNGILGFADLLKRDDLSGEKQKEFIGIIENSGKRMLNIINDIINISKVESGTIEVTISETNINEQIEYIYTFFKPEIEKKGVAFIYKNNLLVKEAVIKTDREKIFAILTNLVKNAIKFTNEGSIEFGYEKKGEFIEFFVKDTGTGISSEQRKIIFERFRQGSESLSRGYEGAGLGLSISKAFVEMLGGKIWVEGDDEKAGLAGGSTFYFTIPYNVVMEEKKDVNNTAPEIKKKDHLHNMKILIVEDDETTEELIKIVIEDYCRNFLIAKNGIEAVQACRNNKDIDLVLMDIKIPELNGYEATKQIRQFNKEVIIIAQTAYALVGDREKAIEFGCNDYLAKPILKEELLALMQKYFKK